MRGGDRRTQQGAANALTALVEIIDGTIIEGYAVNRLGFATDDHGGINDVTFAGRLAVGGGWLIVKDLEAVAGMNVTLEVDLMRIDPHERCHQGVRDMGALTRF